MTKATEGAHEEIDLLGREIEGLNDQCNELEAALRESLKLQSHYAALLNDYDGGKRMGFSSVEAWLNRLRSLKSGEA